MNSGSLSYLIRDACTVPLQNLKYFDPSKTHDRV